MSRIGARVDQLTVEADDPSPTAPLTVRGWLPGPGGVATLDLLGGAATLDIDVAEPDLLVALRLRDPLDDRSRRLAHILLGPTAARAVARVDRVPGEPLVVWRRTEDQRRGRPTPGTRPGGLGLIGRLGLGLAEVTVPGRTESAIAIGLTEAAVTAHDLRGDFAPQPDGTTLLRAGLARWEELTPGSLDAVAGQLAQQQGRWLKTVHGIDLSQTDRLERLIDRHLGRSPRAAAGGTRSMSGFDVAAIRDLPDQMDAPAAAAPYAAGPATHLADSAPIHVAFDPVLTTAGARLVRVEREDHHLLVHLGGLPDEGPAPWLRVFVSDPAGPVPLAFAPIPETDRPWRSAVALVPTGVADRDLLVDVTLSPKEPWPTTTERAVATAVHRGAEAARSGRRSDPAAPDRWREAAGSWAEIGDDRRADLALAYAENLPAAAPSISDLL